MVKVDETTEVQQVFEAYSKIVEWITKHSALSKAEIENIEKSASRISKAFLDMILTKEAIVNELKKIFSVRFPNDSTRHQLVMQSNIRTVSLCPHHMLPVEAVVHYGYISTPGDSVIGLSKFVRIAQTVAKRAVIQEQLTEDLVEIMTLGSIAGTEIGKPVSNHVAVVVNASHGCMTCRGVMSPSRTHTSLFTGWFRIDGSDWKKDFYQGIEESERLK